jgi:hypothetical protein
MATVATLLKGVKYDLRNYGEMDFDEDMMIHYLNRTINILDQRLVQFNSDQTQAIAVTASVKGKDIISAPDRCLEVREVWVGQDRKQNVDQSELYYRQQFKKYVRVEGEAITSGEAYKIIARSTLDFTTVGAADSNAGTYFVADDDGTLGSGDSVWKFDMQEPSYWAWVQTNIEFEAAFSSVKQVKIIYDVGSAAISATSDSMPYNSQYDDIIREVLVQMLFHKKHKEELPTDSLYVEIFDRVMFDDMANRKFSRKQYRLDF